MFILLYDKKHRESSFLVNGIYTSFAQSIIEKIKAGNDPFLVNGIYTSLVTWKAS
jgi:hypothetical protein